MSSEQPSVGLNFSKLFFAIWINSKPHLSSKYLSNKACFVRHVFPPYQLVPLHQDYYFKLTWLQIFYSSYIKNIDVKSILQDTQPIGTVIQKSLKIPEWQMLALHSQAGDQKSRICSH
jgi:hypothetical protein